MLTPTIFAKSTWAKLQVKIFFSMVVWNILSVPYRYFCRVKSGYLVGMWNSDTGCATEIFTLCGLATATCIAFLCKSQNFVAKNIGWNIKEYTEILPLVDKWLGKSDLILYMLFFWRCALPLACKMNFFGSSQTVDLCDPESANKAGQASLWVAEPMQVPV